MLTPVLAAVMLAAAPLAATGGPSGSTASAETIAAARAEADAIIAKANARAWFENVTDSEVPKVRHRPSGLVCSFEPGHAFNSIGLYGGAAPGENVSCHTNVLGFDVSTYAARYTARPSLRQSFDDNVAAIRTRFPSARPYRGAGYAVTTQTATESLRARFQFDGETGGKYTGLTITQLDDWTVKLRVTGPIDKAGEAQMLEVVTWAATLMDFRDSLRR